MMNTTNEKKQIELLWKNFTSDYKLSSYQEDQFRTYCDLLLHWNEKFNITGITVPRSVIKHHFADSLIIQNFFNFSEINSCTDVGSGGGFPGLPLKIAFPHLRTLLIEVNKKKQLFLAEVIKELKLENAEICDLDWRTFLRTTEGSIDLFLTRASLKTDELCRMFKPSCSYKTSLLVYWANREWEAGALTKPFLKEEHPYTISHKKRKLVVLGL